jgi:hypothetical protein
MRARSSWLKHGTSTALGHWQYFSGEGTLPEALERDVIDEAVPAFCLCRAPEGSDEQRRLARWCSRRDYSATDWRDSLATVIGGTAELARDSMH